MLCRVANTLWLAACRPEAARFRRAMARVGDEQRRVLHRLLRANADTAFGREHGFASIASPAEYQARVPVRSYEQLQPWIDAAAAGRADVLTREPVRLFEPTSGSSGDRKLVPYTAALQREFQQAIQPWIADLFQHQPQLLGGPGYWSVSPAAAVPRRTSGGIRIGFDDDTSYLGRWQRPLARAALAVPTRIRSVGDIDRFRYLTLLALVRQESLRLISVWHPTFLSLLIDRLPGWGDALARDLGEERRTVGRLRAALRAGTAAERHAILWPRLALISCWSDARAAAAAAQLGSLFPQARIQPKGIIATEGFISLPLEGLDAPALAVRSHFFEFAAVRADGTALDGPPCLADELERDRRYAVILSNGGGLYRYRLDDIVEVVNHEKDCPLLRFVGRRGYVADWFGEKVNEAYAAGVLGRVLARLEVSAPFAMLACEPSLETPGYVLFIDADASDDTLRQIGAGVDAELRRSFHYDYARSLGQLGPVRVFHAQDGSAAYVRAAMARGQRAGDVKPRALDAGQGWSQRFRGRFV